MAFPFDILSWLVRMRYRASGVSVADGETCEAQCDATGRLKTVIAGGSVGPAPLARSVQSTLTYKGLIVGTAKSLLAIHGFNDSEDDRYLLLINQASGTPPADTAVPFERFLVPAGQSFSYEPAFPVAFSAGILWVVSSTGGVLTIDTGALFHVSATYAAS